MKSAGDDCLCTKLARAVGAEVLLQSSSICISTLIISFPRRPNIRTVLGHHSMASLRLL